MSSNPITSLFGAQGYHPREIEEERIRVQKQQEEEQKSFSERVALFKDKYLDKVTLACAILDQERIGIRSRELGLDEAISTLRSDYYLSGGTILRTFFDAVDATHPSSPVLIASPIVDHLSSHPMEDMPKPKDPMTFAVTVHNVSRKYAEKTYSFADSVIPYLSEELKKKVLTTPNSSRGKKAMKQALSLLESTEFIADYTALQHDLEEYRKKLDAQKGLTEPIEEIKYFGEVPVKKTQGFHGVGW